MAIDPDQVQAIFLAAVECADASQRADLLDRRCGGDADLRSRVQALLAAHDDSGELPLGQLHTDCQTGNYAPGTLIAGRYRLVEEIAAGGMGSVWKAQQIEPVSRQVAIKLVKPGMDSRRVLARFEAERQALARMDHSNIARVFDGGLTPEGRPFFAMEYVEGQAITDYCDCSRLSLAERIRLLMQVCRAVHHAHQKGIIHRDLKPSNVLVARESDEAVPKVIDFGLAKAMHEPLGEESLGAGGASVLGTPRYMSPEQAETNNLDIDTRSDVYSLGVILYELVTGETPLGGKRHQNAALPELLRLTKDQDPTWPSARLAGGAQLAQVAAARRMEPVPLQRAVRGDLDRIVMKALEKDRARRYESAGDLARDLDRYLRHEPVMARAPSTAYRLRKFARRHQVGIVAATLVMATLVAGTITSTVLAIRATRAMRLAEAARADEALHRKLADEQRLAADRARAAEAEQRQIAQNERNEADRRREQAEAGFRQARQAIDEYFTSLRSNRLLNVPALQPLRRELLNSTLAYYRQLIDQHGADPALEADLAGAYLRIGEWCLDLGFHEQAVGALNEATMRFTQLLQVNPDAADYRAEIAFANDRFGQLYQASGRFADAGAAFERALEIRQTLAERYPLDADCRTTVCRAFVRLGNLQRRTEQFTAAEASLRRGLEIQEKLVSEQPGVAAYRSDLADALYYLAHIQRSTGQLKESENSFQRVAEFYEQLVRDVPDELIYRSGMAGTAYNLGHVQRLAGAYPAARRSYQRGLEIYSELSRSDPSQGFYRRSIGGVHFHLGLLDAIEGRSEAARQSWTTALADFQQASQQGYESLGFASSQADALAMLGRYQEAADVLAQALAAGDYHWRPGCQVALLHWAAGDIERYRAQCDVLLDRMTRPAAPRENTAILMTVLCDPLDRDDWQPVLALAQQAVDSTPHDALALAVLGAAQLRAGELAAARTSLEQAAAPNAEGNDAQDNDVQKSARLLSQSFALLGARQASDQPTIGQRAEALAQLVGRCRATVPLYCDAQESWRVAFAVLLAERELSRSSRHAGR